MLINLLNNKPIKASFLATPNITYAQVNEYDSNDINTSEKAKIVSRLYQATFGAKEYCKNANNESRQLFDDTLELFIKETKV